MKVEHAKKQMSRICDLNACEYIYLAMADTGMNSNGSMLNAAETRSDKYQE